MLNLHILTILYNNNNVRQKIHYYLVVKSLTFNSLFVVRPHCQHNMKLLNNKIM